ncbi:MAG: DesA/ISL3 alpha bundle tail domain-containing protein, partial [Gammaproteobacteria bacterium]
FSVRRFEFDIGWGYIRLFSALGLAKVRRTYPRPSFVPRASRIDLDAMRGVVTNRLHVLRAYRREVLMPLMRTELKRTEGASMHRLRYLFVRDTRFLNRTARRDRERLIHRLPQVQTVWQFRENLRAIWEDRAASNERALERLRVWCHEAEQSGIAGLAEFAARLRTWRLGRRAV